MNYELAKELKDAGFPQTNTGMCEYFIDGDAERVGRYEHTTEPSKDSIKIPTLSELIEACVSDGYATDDNFTLTKLPVYQDNEADDMEWQASRFGHFGIGVYPKEAVAYLWLSLNKHDNQEN